MRYSTLWGKIRDATSTGQAQGEIRMAWCEWASHHGSEYKTLDQRVQAFAREVVLETGKRLKTIHSALEGEVKKVALDSILSMQTPKAETLTKELEEAFDGVQPDKLSPFTTVGPAPKKKKWPKKATGK